MSMFNEAAGKMEDDDAISDAAGVRLEEALQRMQQMRDSMRKKLTYASSIDSHVSVEKNPSDFASSITQLQDQIGKLRIVIDTAKSSCDKLPDISLAQERVIGLQDQLISMLIPIASMGLSALNVAKNPQDDLRFNAQQPVPIQERVIPSHRRRRRGAISSESVPAVLPSASITKVIVPKTAEQQQDLKSALQESLLFSDIHEEDLNSIVEAFTPERCLAGTCIMKQGDNGDKFYIVGRGLCDVLISRDGGPAGKVYTVSECGGFGELALMYDSPRAATVVARTDCELWSLDRRTFQTVLMVAITNRRRQYQHFLASVPILAKLTWEERAKIADVMEAKWFEDGEFIIEQGEEGDRIFFIEVGEAIATKSFAHGLAARQVMSYSKGDYFGELALIRNEPRAANVVARGRCKVCAIDKPSFVRLLGPCLEIMNRQIDFYEMHESSEFEELPTDEFELNECLHEAKRAFGGSNSGFPPPNKRRGAVSATPAVSNCLYRNKIPSFPKSSGANSRLQTALRSIILFAHLEQDEVDSVVDAFFEVQKQAGETIITQGEDGDNFYIVDAGECEVYITNKAGTRLVCVAKQGDSFGELALMYNCPRAATVRARSDVVLFALSHEVFTHILRSSAQDRRAQYDSFLQKVPILQGLTREERGKIADVLVQTSFKDADVIIKERDPQANTFYIQFQGEAVAIKTNSQEKSSKVVMHYAPGDYFGEIALIKNIPRSASIVAKGDCKVLSIDRHSFTRLLGPCAEILARKMDLYALEEQQLQHSLTNDREASCAPVALRLSAVQRLSPKPYGHYMAAAGTPSSVPAVTSFSVFAKRASANSRLQHCLRRSAFFAHLEQDAMDSVVDAFFEVQKQAGETIITQGEVGDNFYIVDSGECEVYITNKAGTRLVCVAKQGDSFGELALMYNCPRAATVRARSDVVLFALSHEVFTHILRSSAQDRRAQYDSFLQKVPILQGLTREERGKIADVLVEVECSDGQVIIREGDVAADALYFVLHGSATALVSHGDGGTKDIYTYYPGDYFGERALMSGGPRAASVVARGEVRLLGMDRLSFERLLASCDDLVNRTYPVLLPLPP